MRSICSQHSAGSPPLTLGSNISRRMYCYHANPPRHTAVSLRDDTIGLLEHRGGTEGAGDRCRSGRRPRCRQQLHHHPRAIGKANLIPWFLRSFLL